MPFLKCLTFEIWSAEILPSHVTSDIAYSASQVEFAPSQSYYLILLLNLRAKAVFNIVGLGFCSLAKLLAYFTP